MWHQTVLGRDSQPSLPLLLSQNLLASAETANDEMEDSDDWMPDLPSSVLAQSRYLMALDAGRHTVAADPRFLMYRPREARVSLLKPSCMYKALFPVAIFFLWLVQAACWLSKFVLGRSSCQLRLQLAVKMHLHMAHWVKWRTCAKFGLRLYNMLDRNTFSGHSWNINMLKCNCVCAGNSHRSDASSFWAVPRHCKWQSWAPISARL